MAENKKRKTLAFVFERESDKWREAKHKVASAPDNLIDEVFADGRRDHIRKRARKLFDF
jgi:hypothetical protein